MITLVVLYLKAAFLIASFSYVKKFFFDLNTMEPLNKIVELYLGHIQIRSSRKILAANEWREDWKCMSRGGESWGTYREFGNPGERHCDLDYDGELEGLERRLSSKRHPGKGLGGIQRTICGKQGRERVQDGTQSLWHCYICVMMVHSFCFMSNIQVDKDAYYTQAISNSSYRPPTRGC